MWEDLGFYADDGRFHIHSVTGPDEYTTVVNDNTYTNLMARLNLNYAAASLRAIEKERPADYAALVAELDLSDQEIEAWERAAEAMFVPYDERRGMHPQDANFLEREVWDLEATPAEHFPLLLHYHPLVIYRHQVIKQADIVLAMFLLGNEFSPGAEARELRLLRRAHDRRLVAVGVHPEHRRGRGRKARRGARLLPLRAADGPRKRRREHLRRGAHRLGGGRLAVARVRLRRRARVRRRAVDHAAPALPGGSRWRSRCDSAAAELRIALTHEEETYTLDEGDPLELTVRAQRHLLTVAGSAQLARRLRGAARAGRCLAGGHAAATSRLTFGRPG